MTRLALLMIEFIRSVAKSEERKIALSLSRFARFGQDLRKFWWTQQDLNLRPLACEASALTGLSYASTVSVDYRFGWVRVQGPHFRGCHWRLLRLGCNANP